MTILVSNLHSTIDNDKLRQFFSPFGEVKSAEISKDVFNGQSRGFGYVVMDDDAAAIKAIEGLDLMDVQQLIVSVSKYQPIRQQKASYKVGNSSVPVYKFKKS